MILSSVVFNDYCSVIDVLILVTFINQCLWKSWQTFYIHLKVWSKLKPKSYLYITKWEHKTNIEWSKRGYFFTALLMNLKLVGHVGVLLSIKIARSAHRKSNSGFELPMPYWDSALHLFKSHYSHANWTFSSIIITQCVKKVSFFPFLDRFSVTVI